MLVITRYGYFLQKSNFLSRPVPCNSVSIRTIPPAFLFSSVWLTAGKFFHMTLASRIYLRDAENIHTLLWKKASPRGEALFRNIEECVFVTTIFVASQRCLRCKLSLFIVTEPINTS